METKIRELVQSIDQAITVAEQMRETEILTQIEGLISVLKTIKFPMQTINDTIGICLIIRNINGFIFQIRN